LLKTSLYNFSTLNYNSMMKKAMVLLIDLMGAFAAIAPGGELIVNGDFSTGDCEEIICFFKAPDT
jgi:hypothetical protein